jgi:hypothetical protein
MEIELILEPTYTVRANGREILGMSVISEWEGLRKLEDDQGRSLIIAGVDGPLTHVTDVFGNKGSRWVVLIGTPDIVN